MGNHSGSQKSPAAGKDAARTKPSAKEEKLAQALRRNLARRKQAAKRTPGSDTDT